MMSEENEQVRGGGWVALRFLAGITKFREKLVKVGFLRIDKVSRRLLLCRGYV